MTLPQSSSDLLFAIELAGGRYAHPLCLNRHHGQVYSQNGEDGMIAELFSRIGIRDHVFVEIGVGDGQENNTRFLLEQGWRGIWIEGNPENVAKARHTFGDFLTDRTLTIVEAAATVENVDALLDQAGAPETFDLLSLDIDQHTGHVWRALRRRSRAACIEYNASLPPVVAVEVAYDPAREWDGTNWFGSSLKTLEQIAASKGMSLVSCDLLGVNAFFVVAEEARGHFREPFTAAAHWEPPRYALLSHTGHPASADARRWVAGVDT